MRDTTYGQRGGQGPNRGKTATIYLVTLPDGTTTRRRSFSPTLPAKVCGYAYERHGKWTCAGLGRKNDPRLRHMVECPAEMIQ